MHSARGPSKSTRTSKSLSKSPKSLKKQKPVKKVSKRHSSTTSSDGPTKNGKLDVNTIEDIFRAQRLAGLGDKYHEMSQAFDLIRAEGVTPQMEEDLQRVFDVTSLRTADAAELRKAKTAALITHYQRRPGDTGSAEVQAVLLTERINTLKFHVSRHPQDHQLTRQIQMIEHRLRKTLQYLKRERFRTYQVICRDLGVDEHAMVIVGKLPKNKPYYNPTRPIYRKPLTIEQLREQAANQRQVEELAAKQVLVDKKNEKLSQIAERRRQANMIDI